MNIITSICIGSLLLVLLCWNDFQDKVMRPRSFFLYFTAFILFIMTNMALYLLLLSIVLGKDPIMLVVSSKTMHYSGLELAQPIIVSLMYFGAGAYTFKFGEKEFNLYRKIIAIFQSLFKWSVESEDKIRKTIVNSQTEQQKLIMKIKDLHDKAENRNWDILKDKWEDIQSDTKLIDEHVAHLLGINNDLDVHMQPNKIEEIKNALHERIHELQDRITIQLKKYLCAFIFKNIKKESEIENILVDMAIEPPQLEKNTSLPANILYRSLAISFFFGLLFGPILCLRAQGDAMAPVLYSWYGAISLSVFGFILSLIKLTKKRFQDVIKVIAMGGLAGFGGYIVWNLLSRIIPLFLKGQLQDATALVGSILIRSIIGIEFGIAISLLLYVFRWPLKSALPSTPLKYVGIGLSGGIIFVLITIADSYQKLMGIDKYIGLGLLGFVVLIAMAFAMDIFNYADDAPPTE